MKKLFTTVLMVLASGAVFALPVGNPSEASLLCDGVCWEGHCGDMCDPSLTWCDAFSVRIGFYGDYIFQRNLQLTSEKDGQTQAAIEHSRIFTNAGYFAANFWDRVDIFATAGASSWYIDGNGSAFAFAPSSTFQGSWVEVQSETTFSWSVGARGTIWEFGCTSLGLEFQYFQFRPRVHSVNLFNNATALDNGLINPANNINSNYYDWQVGLGVSHRIHCFVPYAAVKWSHANLSMGYAKVGGAGGTAPGNYPVLRDSDSTNLWGYAVGVSVVDCEKAALTGEFRGGDELAAYINGQFRF